MTLAYDMRTYMTDFYLKKRTALVVHVVFEVQVGK